MKCCSLESKSDSVEDSSNTLTNACEGNMLLGELQPLCKCVNAWIIWAKNLPKGIETWERETTKAMQVAGPVLVHATLKKLHMPMEHDHLLALCSLNKWNTYLVKSITEKD